MSPSLIRCLLAILALTQNCDKTVSKDVAYLLGIKRPSAHRSLTILQEKGLIEKAPYGDIHLTEAGLALALALEARRDELTVLFANQYGLDPDECVCAALALMGSLRDDSLDKMKPKTA